MLFSGLAVIIFILSFLISSIDTLMSDKTSNATSEGDTRGNYRHPVAAAIKSYQETRGAQERECTKHDAVTIKVLIATGGFALLAAVAAIVSAWIFQGQL